MATHVTGYTANAQENFLVPWGERQLYQRADLWRFVQDDTARLMALGPQAKGLDYVRDAGTGYFTSLPDRATNDPFGDEGSVTTKETLEIDETKNIDLIFDYSEVEINAMTTLGMWADNQAGRIARLYTTRDRHVMTTLKNAKTGAGNAENQKTLAIAKADAFLGEGGTPDEIAAAKPERERALAHLATVNIDLWGRGMDIWMMGGGTQGYGEIIHLVNSQLYKALVYRAIAEAGNSGVGFQYDEATMQGRLTGVIGANRVVVDHTMDNALTAAGDEYLSISFPTRAVKGLFPRRGGQIRQYKVDPDTGNPTPILIMGQRFAYATGLFDDKLVIALKAAVTADS